MDQLESALVITLRDTLKWESSVEISSNGTLPAVNPSKPFNPHDYLARDRQLGYRDLCVGAAINSVSASVADVWHYLGPAPLLQGPAPAQLPFAAGEIKSNGTLTQLRHVLNASIPWDAARYSDADLYGRDALVFEILSRAAKAALTASPVVPVDSAGTLVSLSGSAAWSLAEGVEQRSDVSPALVLRRDLFKVPDQNLADRDNQLAGYVAQVAQVLKNPFIYADRLYMRVDNVDTREAEVYTLFSDDGITRMWKAEPALFGRFEIHYTVASGLLQWFSEKTDSVHVPQLYAMSIPGIEPGQLLTTLPAVPEAKDAMYWRQKAGQVVPDGVQLTDTPSLLSWTSSGDVQNCLITPDSAMLTVPGRGDFTLPGLITPGRYRINVLVQPESKVELLGAENITATGGTLGGADYDINVPNTGIVPKRYLVQNGQGVIYNGTQYDPEATFVGIGGNGSYAQVSATDPSTIRQYGVNFQLALPPGAWTLAVEYTNLTGTATGFGVQVLYQQPGANPVTVIQDVVPVPFSGDNGTLFTTHPTHFEVMDANQFTLPVYWTFGDGQFHIRKLIFDSDVITTGSYQMTALFAGSAANINVSGLNHLVDTMQFVVDATGTTNANVSLLYSDAVTCPIKIKQLDIQSLGTYANTPSSDGFTGWRQECLDRAETVIRENYDTLLGLYGTNTPSFRTSGSIWDWFTNEAWMGFMEVTNPRLRELEAPATVVVGRQYLVLTGIVSYDGHSYPVGTKFYGTLTGGTTIVGGTVKQVGALIKSRPGHVGRPALIPYGVYLESTGTAKSFYDTAFSSPIFASCQPWMIDFGVYVAGNEYWMPEFYSGITRSSLLAAPPAPPPPGVLHVTPIPLAFASNVQIGSTGTAFWDVTNTGGAAFTGSVTLSTGSFTLAGNGSFTISPGIHESLGVIYTPTTAAGTSRFSFSDAAWGTFTGGGGAVSPITATGTTTACPLRVSYPTVTPPDAYHIYYAGEDKANRTLWLSNQDGFWTNVIPTVYKFDIATFSIVASYPSTNQFAPFGSWSVGWDANLGLVIMLSQAHGWATMDPIDGVFRNSIGSITQNAGSLNEMAIDSATGIALTCGANSPGPTNGHIQIIQHTSRSTATQLYDSGFTLPPLYEGPAFSTQADKFIVTASSGTVPFYYVNKNTGAMTPTAISFTSSGFRPLTFSDIQLLVALKSNGNPVFIDPVTDTVLATGTTTNNAPNGGAYDACNGRVYISSNFEVHVYDSTNNFAHMYTLAPAFGLYFDKWFNAVIALHSNAPITSIV